MFVTADRYDLIIASIFRDSCGYLARYFAQVESVLQTGKRVGFCWLEGDSRDGTFTQLESAMNRLGDRYDCETTLVKYDVGGPYWPSIDHADRWKQLANVWNRNLSLLRLVPAQHVMFVESDLIWQAEHVQALLSNLAFMDVAYGALFKANGTFYDTHATVTNGEHWTVHPPYYPPNTQLVDGQWVPVETSGGMIVTTGDVVQNECQGWSEDGCVLQFSPELTTYVDMSVRVIHP